MLSRNESPTALHIVQGGIANGDKKFLERAALGNQGANSWVVPKSVTIGDDVVIYIGGFGLFATARIRSLPRPKAGWTNRYGANLDSIRLVEPSVSLAAVRRRIPKFGWAIYPRSVTTPSAEIATQIRALIKQRRQRGTPEDIDDRALAEANIDELKRVALLRSRPRATPRERQTIYRARSTAIRLFVLKRAAGRCEGCGAPAPFRGTDGSPFLEAHHTTRLADEGPDHPGKVIGVCPNCHRRAHYSGDAKTFNAALIRKVAKIERSSKK